MRGKQRSSQTATAQTAPGLAAVALFVAAANLRPAIAAVSPLADTIRSDLGLSAVGVALLTTLPTLAMGVCAPLAAAVGRRQGLHRGVMIGLVIVMVATAARAGGESTWLQMSCATVAGVGIAITQTLLPAVVRTRFADRAQLMTGIYTAGLGLGAVVAVGVSIPLTHIFESWPAALGSWAVLALIGTALWAGGVKSLDLANAVGPSGPAIRGLSWREPLARRITAVSAVNSALYYVELAWLVPLLHNEGHRTISNAGDLLTIMLIIQTVSMIVIPATLGERLDRRIGLVVTVLMVAGGFFGLAFSPATATWVWMILIGIGHGGLFPLVLALPATMSRDGTHASHLSGMAFFVGYGCAAVAPLAVGWLREDVGSFTFSFAVLGAAATVMVIPISRLLPSSSELRPTS